MSIRPLALGLIALAAGARADAPPAAGIPAARWEAEGAVVEVMLAEPAGLATQPLSAPLHYAIGVVAMPMVVLQPEAALAWPFYMLLAAPWQARFNHQSATVSHALVTPALPQTVVTAFAAQWTARDGRPAFTLQLRIESYGLTTRSGRTLEAFEPKEDLCLAVSAQWTLTKPGVVPHTQALMLTPSRRDADAPPPICLPLARWAEDDGRRTRQAVAELGEVLAALLLQRLAAVP